MVSSDILLVINSYFSRTLIMYVHLFTLFLLDIEKKVKFWSYFYFIFKLKKKLIYYLPILLYKLHIFQYRIRIMRIII